MRPTTWIGLAAALAMVAACSTDPGNSYGSGGTTGTIQVRDSLIGTKNDPSPFTLTANDTQKSLAEGGVASFTGLAPGDYVVTIGALENCTVAGGNSQSVQVFAGYIQYLTLVTTCT